MSESQATNPLKRAGEAPAEPAHDNKKSKAAEDPTAGDSMDIEENDDDDDLAEIDPSNIISGSRTRGKKIDFTKVNDLEGEEDDDDDEDVVLGDETMDMEEEEEDSGEEEEEEEEEA